MEKIWEQIKENKVKIFLFLLITIIAICGFTYYGKNRTEKQMLNAEIKESEVSQTTVPDGYIGIYNADDLANVNNNLSGKYILMADIDMTGKNHTIIGQTSTDPFTGEFDGNFHKISNLTIESANLYVGMFGYVKEGKIKDLTLENEIVKGTYVSASSSRNDVCIGGLIGDNNSGEVKKIQITGTSKIGSEVIGKSNYVHIGGLIGRTMRRYSK